VSNIENILARAEARDIERMREQIAEREARAAEAEDFGLRGSTPAERRHFRAWSRNGFRPTGGRFRL
jgi:hypothetical protein